MLDQIGSAHMEQGEKTNFVKDKFDKENSALALNFGWTKVPSGVYFNTEQYTITAWIYSDNIQPGSRLIDFGDYDSHAVIIELSELKDKHYTPSFQIRFNGEVLLGVYSSQKLTTNKWQFMVASFDGYGASIYIDGQLVGSSEKSSKKYLPFVGTRDYCNIGKSNWADDGRSSSYIDDLRFYGKALSQEEIMELMST